ncbi:MAG: CBS domain-containing protein [bacterium]
MNQSVSVKDYMAQYVLTFKPEQDIIEAAQMLADRGVSGAPVVDDLGNLVGVLSDTDCMEASINAGFHPGWRGQVRDFMSSDVATVESDSSIVKVAERFAKDRYRRYPVMEDNRLVGQISRLDVLKALNSLSN